jgi:hypothetical protein
MCQIGGCGMERQGSNSRIDETHLGDSLPKRSLATLKAQAHTLARTSILTLVTTPGCTASMGTRTSSDSLFLKGKKNISTLVLLYRRRTEGVLWHTPLI